MQLQLSLIYLAAAQAKLNGSAWPQGTAASYALRLPDMLLLPMPHWFITSALLMNAVTWGALAVELSVGILVWNRRLRPWVLAAGAVMHTMVMVTIAVGFFTPAVLVLYLAFAPPEMVERLPYSANYMATKLMAALRRPGTKRRRLARYAKSGEDEESSAECCIETSAGARTPVDD
jgi:vitamin K-dependent gamma-carboxylase-like protein